MNKQFKFVKTPISKLVRLERKIIGDDRGYLSRLYCAEDLKEVGLKIGFKHVASGPLVRSSYHADEQARMVKGTK